MPDDFKQAIEQIKLRVPIEELVRERVPLLKKRGRLWSACCPFHEESTPSFKVDPSRGSWRCFGACAEGGDVIQFLIKHDRLEFREALELLAVRAGVELPRSGWSAAPRRAPGEDDPLYDVVGRALEYYRRQLHSAAGAQALGYLKGRGLSAATIEAFGLGFAPPQGDVLVQKVLSQGLALEPLLATGLARRNEQGRVYDFFRGRLTIPIRDDRGRAVGFGARRLDDADKAAPKYVNTGETGIFHKGRLVYALDAAQREIRRTGHMVLVEGYTDVMAAHQAGLRNVVAVLGTALTEEHAALVRRSGAKRVTLCFDGDAAGGQATWRALAGLVPLDVQIDVVRLAFDDLGPPPSSGAEPPAVKDPCDLLVHYGAAAFEAQLARATDWFDFLVAAVEALGPLADRERLAAVDRVLELVARIQKPIARDAKLTLLASRLGYSLHAVHEQFQSLPARIRAPSAEAAAKGDFAARRAESPKDSATPGTQAAPARWTPQEQRLSAAWRESVGAVLLDGSLVGALAQLAADARGAQAECPEPDVASLAQELAAIAERERGLPELDALFTALWEHPARHLLVPLIQHAERAETPASLFAGARLCIERARAEKLRAQEVANLPRLALESPAEHEDRLLRILNERRREVAAAEPMHGAPARN